MSKKERVSIEVGNLPSMGVPRRESPNLTPKTWQRLISIYGKGVAR
jgi:hypothetical protein